MVLIFLTGHFVWPEPGSRLFTEFNYNNPMLLLYGEF